MNDNNKKHIVQTKKRLKFCTCKHYGIRYIFVLFPYLNKQITGKTESHAFSVVAKRPPKIHPSKQSTSPSPVSRIACVGLPKPLYTKLGCSFGSHLCWMSKFAFLFFFASTKKSGKPMGFFFFQPNKNHQVIFWWGRISGKIRRTVLCPMIFL